MARSRTMRIMRSTSALLSATVCANAGLPSACARSARPISMRSAVSICPSSSCSSRESILRSSSCVRTSWFVSRRSSCSACCVRPCCSSELPSSTRIRITAMIATARPECQARRQRGREVLMQLALARGRRLLLSVQRAVVDRLDFGRDPHDRIAARHDLPAQKTVAIDLGRAVEERRIRAPVLVELPPQLAVLFRIGFAQAAAPARRSSVRSRDGRRPASSGTRRPGSSCRADSRAPECRRDAGSSARAAGAFQHRDSACSGCRGARMPRLPSAARPESTRLSAPGAPATRRPRPATSENASGRLPPDDVRSPTDPIREHRHGTSSL